VGNIVITNVYGYKNIGDGAILESALKILNKPTYKQAIHIHSATNFVVKNENNIQTFLHPYGTAIRTSSHQVSILKKALRFSKILFISTIYTLAGKINYNALPTKGDYAYIKSLRDASSVFGIGGGYFRTKAKYKDYFGLILTLLPILIAHFYNKRILYLPMSYGNFASEIHNKMVYKCIKNDLIIFRDQISLEEFNKNSSKKSETYLIPDLALFDNEYAITKKENYIVLTARLWMDKSSQENYEKELALFVDYAWEKYKLKTIFIPMAWNKTEDDDSLVGERIKQLLSNKSIFYVRQIQNPTQAKKIISHATAAICTRLHSAILSTVVKTPFITIAYEYKTQGFLKHIGLEDWNINIQKLTSNELINKFDALMTREHKTFISQLKIAHRELTISKVKLSEIVNKFRLEAA
jgi:polysaccharide pyruvyl transferase WcaK-like protein